MSATRTGPQPSPPSTSPPSTRRPPTRSGGLFRAFWRWHFYAGLVVVPVLLVLASTGLVYLFRFQLEPLLHGDLARVQQPSGSTLTQPYAVQQRAVERAHPGAQVVSLTEPAGPDRSTVFSVTTAGGEGRDVFVDPWTAEVLGDLDPDATLSGTAIRLHANLMSGRTGDLVMELGTCWALVSAVTGYVLLVRGRAARRRVRRAGRPGARLRSGHAVLGGVVGVGLVAMLVTGLPWTGVFGGAVQRVATAGGSSMWSTDPGAASSPSSTLDESLPHSHAAVPWGLQRTPVPSGSSSDGAGPDDASVADVDTAVAVAGRAGLRHPMTVALPVGERGTFSVIGYAFDAPSDERTVHVDRYGGTVRSAYGFADYPVLAKVVAHGIGLHEGRSLGTPNLVLSALFGLGVLALCVTGPLAWWRRRPSGLRTGAPRGRMPLRATPWLGAVVAVLAVLLPVFGVSLVAVLLLDRLVLRRVPALGDFFEAQRG
ncbi:MAG: hypothetical protein JWR20_1618 [Marmoricola sp.]|nr:hypothetical protein [Marmoricola sp.]